MNWISFQARPHEQQSQHKQDGRRDFGGTLESMNHHFWHSCSFLEDRKEVTAEASEWQCQNNLGHERLQIVLSGLLLPVCLGKIWTGNLEHILTILQDVKTHYYFSLLTMQDCFISFSVAQEAAWWLHTEYWNAWSF